MDNGNKCNSVMVLAHYMKSGKWDRICWVVPEIWETRIIDGDDLAEDEDGVAVEAPSRIHVVLENLFDNGEEYYPDEPKADSICEKFLGGNVPNWIEVDVGSTDGTDATRDRVDKIRFVATIARPNYWCETAWRFLRSFPQMRELPADFNNQTAQSVLECDETVALPGRLNGRLEFRTDDDGWCWLDAPRKSLPLGRIEQDADELCDKIDLALDAMLVGATFRKGE